MPDVPNFDEWVKTRTSTPRGLDPAFQSQVDDIVKSLQRRGLNARLTEGYRAPERQDELFAQGRTKPGRIVTNATGRTGKHPRGIAADIDLLDANGRPLRDSDPAWSAIGEEASRRGLTWGGNWKMRDMRHVEIGQSQRQRPAQAVPKFDKWRPESGIPKFDDWAKDSEQNPRADQNRNKRQNPSVTPKQSQAQSAPNESIEVALRRLTEQVNRSMEPLKRQAARPQQGVGELRRLDEPEVKRVLAEQRSTPNRILNALGTPSSAYDPRAALRWLVADTSTAEQRQAEAERQQRVAQTSRSEYLAQAPKSAVMGAASTAETGLKAIAVLAKKLDWFSEYEGKQASDLGTYRAGEWIRRNAQQILQSNPDLEQDFIVGKGPQAIGQAASFLLGGLATKAPKLTVTILGAGMSGGSAYDEVKAVGGTDDEAVNAGILSGAILGPTELIGMRRLMKALAGTPAERTLRNGLIRALRDGSRDAAENALQEVGQEYAQGKITGVSREGRQLLEAGALAVIASGGVSTAASLANQIGGRRARQVEAQPDVTALPEAVQSGAEAPIPQKTHTNEPQGSGGSPGEVAQRFYHKDWGEVEVLADQSGARPGRVKVAEVADPTRQHFPKRSDLRGRGNERMVPIKLEPSSDPTVSPETPANETLQLNENLEAETAASEPANKISAETAAVPGAAVTTESPNVSVPQIKKPQVNPAVPKPAVTTAAGFKTELSLSQFVRKMGGIAPADVYRGELDRLRLREARTTGLVNQNARQGNVAQTADIMMQAANDAGYRDPQTGRPFENPGDFLYAVERDVLGDKIRVRSGDEDFSAAEAEYYAEQEVRVRAEEARSTFLESGRGAELFDRIVDRKATDAEQQEYIELAERAGISRAESADLIADARAEIESLQGDGREGSQSPSRPAEQLGFVEEGLTQQEATPPQPSDKRGQLLREQKDREAQLNPERTAAQAKIEEIKRRGMTVDDYARQPDLMGNVPSAEEIAQLRELEGQSRQPHEMTREEFKRLFETRRGSAHGYTTLDIPEAEWGQMSSFGRFRENLKQVIKEAPAALRSLSETAKRRLMGLYYYPDPVRADVEATRGKTSVARGSMIITTPQLASAGLDLPVRTTGGMTFHEPPPFTDFLKLRIRANEAFDEGNLELHAALERLRDDLAIASQEGSSPVSFTYVGGPALPEVIAHERIHESYRGRELFGDQGDNLFSSYEWDRLKNALDHADSWGNISVRKGDDIALSHELLAYGLTGRADNFLNQMEIPPSIARNALKRLIIAIHDAHGGQAVEEIAKFATRSAQRFVQRSIASASQRGQRESLPAEPQPSAQDLQRTGRGSARSRTPLRHTRRGESEVEEEWSRIHRSAVERALAEGRSVPSKVLAEYPDLAKTADRPRAFGPGTMRAGEPLPEVKERKFGKRFTEDERIADEIRSEIGTAKYYEPIPNKITAAEAAKLVEQRGIGESIRIIRDEKNDLPAHIRSTMGQIVIQQLNQTYRNLKAAGSDKAQGVLDQAVDLAEWAMDYGTRLGQGVQSFAMWSRLTPEGMLQTYKRSVKKARERHQKRFGEDVAEIVSTVNREGVTDAERLEAIKNLFNTNKTARKIKSDFEKLLKAAKGGKLTDETFYDIVGAKLGLPSYSKETTARITDLANQIEAAPEGLPRTKLVLELQKFIAEQKGFDVVDLPLGIFYGNILSGYNTHAVNFADTGLNVLSEINGLALNNPRAAAKIYAGMLRGFAEGRWDAMLALTEGRMFRDSKWLDAPGLMEVAKFGEKGGVPIKTETRVGRIAKRAAESKLAIPLNAYKYVSRAMSASDAVMARSASEARASLLAYKMAKDEGLTGAALETRVREILAFDRDADFMAQAQREGFTGKEAAFRAHELREMARPKDLSADAAEFAGEATYNHTPHGTLGLIAERVGNLSNDIKPLKLFVPFTRIVANVTNRGLNYTPYGYKRAFAGWGFGKTTEPLTAEGRRLMLTRATMGTAGMVLLAGLQEAGLIAIHGNGPTDREKRRQLQNAGWRPYSLQIGSNYISYVYSPVGLGLSIIGNMKDSDRYHELEQKDAATRGAYAVARLGSTIFSQSFLSGLSRLFSALSDRPEVSVTAVKQTLGGTTAAFAVPNLARDIHRLFDNKAYQSNTLTEDLIRNTPFAALALRPQLNAFGEPVKLQRQRFFDKLTSDQAWRFVIQKGLRVPVPGRTTEIEKGKRITPEQYYELLQKTGPQIRQWIIDNQQILEPMTETEAQDELSDAATAIRKRALDEMRGKMVKPLKPPAPPKPEAPARP